MMWRRAAAPLSGFACPASVIASGDCLPRRQVSANSDDFRPSDKDKPHPQPRTATGAVPSVPRFRSYRSEALRERVVARQFSVRERDLPPSRDTELLPQDIAMRFRRPWRDAEPLSNLFVGATCRDQLDDLLLSRSQNGRARLQHRRHGLDGNKVVPAWLLTERSISTITPPAARALAVRTTPHGPVRWRSAAALARALRYARGARIRRAGASASSPARRSRS
jgi:hypothetical protein